MKYYILLLLGFFLSLCFVEALNLGESNVQGVIIQQSSSFLGNNATFNATYNNLLGQNCPSGMVVNGTLANGTFICTTDQTGGSGSANYTNLAYLNNSNTFIRNNTFTQEVQVRRLIANNTNVATVAGGSPAPAYAAIRAYGKTTGGYVQGGIIEWGNSRGEKLGEIGGSADEPTSYGTIYMIGNSTNAGGGTVGEIGFVDKSGYTISSDTRAGLLYSSCTSPLVCSFSILPRNGASFGDGLIVNPDSTLSFNGAVTFNSQTLNGNLLAFDINADNVFAPNLCFSNGSNCAAGGITPAYSVPNHWYGVLGYNYSDNRAMRVNATSIGYRYTSSGIDLNLTTNSLYLYAGSEGSGVTIESPIAITTNGPWSHTGNIDLLNPGSNTLTSAMSFIFDGIADITNVDLIRARNITAGNICYSDGTNCTGSSGSSFNATYNNLLGQNCPVGMVVNGTLANGTFICKTDQTGGGSSAGVVRLINVTSVNDRNNDTFYKIVSNLSFKLESNKTYRYQYSVWYLTNGTDRGIGINLTMPSTIVNNYARYEIMQTATANTFSIGTGFSSAAALGTAGLTSPTPIFIEGTVKTGTNTNGNLNFSYRAETASPFNNVTILNTSSVEYWVIG